MFPFRGRMKQAVSWFSVTVAALFYLVSVLRLDIAETSLLDLDPRPDAAEYFAVGRSMAQGEVPSIHIGADRLPSRYPPGYPVLMLPWFAMLPDGEEILAPFRTSQMAGLVMLFTVFSFYRRVKGPMEAGVTALLLATLPTFFIYCRASMSETCGSLFVCLAFMSAYLGLRERSRRWLYACALFLGLAVNIRVQLVFFGPILLAMAFLGDSRHKVAWFLHCVGVLACFALCLVPVLLVNWAQFGRPMMSGYGCWVSSSLLIGGFAQRYLPPNLLMCWNELRMAPNGYMVGNIFGTGSHVTPAFAILVVLGLFYVRNWRFSICAGLAVACGGLPLLAFWYLDLRKFHTLAVLGVALAVLPVFRALNALAEHRPKRSIPILLLACCAVMGFPSTSGYPKRPWRSQFLDGICIVPYHRPRVSVDHVAANELLEQTQRGPCTVLTSINPVFVDSVLPSDYLVVPLDERHDFRHSPFWRFGTNEVQAVVRRALEGGEIPYALLSPRANYTSEVARLPAVEGRVWVPCPRVATNSLVWSLSLP